jgi:hypothetical protein
MRRLVLAPYRIRNIFTRPIPVNLTLKVLSELRSFGLLGAFRRHAHFQGKVVRGASPHAHNETTLEQVTIFRVEEIDLPSLFVFK